MTTKFKTKYDALMKGLFYAGRTDIKAKNMYEILHHPAIRIVDRNIEQLGYVHEDNTAIEFKNSNKIKICMVTTGYRDGFDLWLVIPDESSLIGALRV